MTLTRTGLTEKAPALLIGIYCRISSDEEGRRLGVQRQERDCRARAARIGGTVVKVYIDNDISATMRSTKARPEYDAMMADAAAGTINCILAYTTSRLTRRPREVEDQIDLALDLRLGNLFRYVSSIEVDLLTSAGRKHARQAGGADAGTADDISELVLAQKLQAAADGLWRGGRRPFGFHADMTLHPTEMPEAVAASEALLMGATLHGLTTDFNRRGIFTTAGNRWDSQSMRRMLQRAMNAGVIERYGEIVGPATWEGFVTLDQVLAIRAILGDPKRRTTPGPARRWLGSGIYLCGRHPLAPAPEPGGKVATMHVRSRDGEPRYRCREANHLGRRQHPVDYMINELIIKYLGTDEAREMLRHTEAGDTATLHLERSSIRERLDGLARLFTAGALDEQQLAEGSAQGLADLRAVNERIAAASQGSVLSGLADAEDPRAAWTASRLDRRRSVVQALMVVTILPVGPGLPTTVLPDGTRFDPTGVDVQWREWPR